MKTHHGRLTLQECRDAALKHLDSIERQMEEDRAMDFVYVCDDCGREIGRLEKAKPCPYCEAYAAASRAAEERGAQWALEAQHGERGAWDAEAARIVREAHEKERE